MAKKGFTTGVLSLSCLSFLTLAMFAQLVLPPVTGGFGGEITTLKPAGKSTEVVMDNAVLLQFVEVKITFPTDVAAVFPQVLPVVFRGKMILQVKI